MGSAIHAKCHPRVLVPRQRAPQGDRLSVDGEGRKWIEEPQLELDHPSAARIIPDLEPPSLPLHLPVVLEELLASEEPGRVDGKATAHEGERRGVRPDLRYRRVGSGDMVELSAAIGWR